MRRVKKSRNGCARCKSKRVKCGEEKPQCSRCLRLGVKCPGYVQSLRWVTKYEEPENDNIVDRPNGSPSNERSSPSFSPSLRSSVPSDLINPVSASPVAFNGGVIPGPAGQSGELEGVDQPNALCDNLWNLQGAASLPELTDLCPPSPAGATAASGAQDEDSGFDFTNNMPDTSFLFPLAAPVLQNENHPFQGFSPSAIVRSFPPSPKPPHRNQLSISRPLNNPSWTLIEYYFKEVAALFSSYDSQLNPFRSTVSRLWGSSLAMCRTMQSMAAATLVNDFPQFGPIGLKMRNEAVDIIAKEAALDDKSLLALLMLGQTASWHDPKDLGISFFNLLRKHINVLSSADGSGYNFRGGSSNNYRFFEEALIYWEMLLSFVADNDAVAHSGSPTPGMEDSMVLQQVPHPWTGIARHTQFTVQEVGRLIRRERKRARACIFTSQEDITHAQRAIEQARVLEERLLSLAHPAEAEIVSPGDDETPVWHLLTMAEVYRCTGLMQLYRTFPDLLRCRLPLHTTSSSSSSHPYSTHQSSTSTTTAVNRDLFFSVDPLLDNLPGFPDFEPRHSEQQHQQQPPISSSSSSDTYYDSWLSEFALTTLSRLKTIPLESRTRCLQPFLLVAASSELRLPRPTPSSDLNPDSNDPTGISSHAIEVSTTRKFILGRLTSFLHVLPPKPIDVCLRLVREVWRRMDAGESDVYWVDVMIDNGWETTMG